MQINSQVLKGLHMEVWVVWLEGTKCILIPTVFKATWMASKMMVMDLVAIEAQMFFYQSMETCCAFEDEMSAMK